MLCSLLALAVGAWALLFWAALPAAAQEAGAMLVVQRFEVEPSAILTEDELAAVLDRYTGRPMAVDELQRMIAELDALYEAKGFVARATLPPQTIADGIVQVQLIEGRIHAVVVDGNRHTRTSFIAGRLGLRAGDLVDLNAMAESLATFNATYDVALRAELRPGQEFGTTDYLVHVGEPRNDRFTFWTDNGGRSETGTDRHSFSWTRRSLLGFRDPLSLTISGGTGSRSASLSYSWPVGASGTRLGTGYSYSQVDVIDGDFGDVGLRSDSSNAHVDIRFPFQVAGLWPSSLSVSYNARESGTYFEGHKLTGRSFGVWQATAGTQIATGSSQWDLGYVLRIGPKSATTDPFVTHKLSATWQRRLWRGVLLAGASGQLTDSTLLPHDERYTIGGTDSNRGYEAGRGEGDRGYSLNVEYTVPLTSRIQGTIHLDHGGVMPYKGNEEPITEEDFLTSVALAVNAQLTELVGLRLLWGVPLDAHGSGSTFYFRLQAAF